MHKLTQSEIRKIIAILANDHRIDIYDVLNMLGKLINLDDIVKSLVIENNNIKALQRLFTSKNFNLNKLLEITPNKSSLTNSDKYQYVCEIAKYAGCDKQAKEIEKQILIKKILDNLKNIR